MVTPHYRLEQSLKRTGVPVARSTINDLFRRAGQKLEPLRAPLFETITKDFLVHVDETSFKLTTQTSKAFIWAFVGQSLTGYTFALTRGGDVPLDLLGESTGAFLCDDYRGYDPLEKKGKRRRSGCLAHARRKYFEAGDVPEASKELALLYSLVVSCTRLAVNPVDYLADVLDRIDKTADDGMRDLLPDRWKPPAKPATATDFVA